jgi:hypothetical protein
MDAFTDEYVGVRVAQPHPMVDDAESEYPSDTNYHRFDLNVIKDMVSPQAYEFASDSLTFLHGPGPADPDNCGHVHQKKNYKVCIQVPPHVFPPLREMRLKSWEKNPDNFKHKHIPVFRYVIVLFLGTLSRIVRAYHPSIRTASKSWVQTIRRSSESCAYTFDVTFTHLTSHKLKSIPLRLYAQLSYESNFDVGTMEFLAQGQSLMFMIHSHSQQYGYVRVSACPLCGHNKAQSQSQSQSQSQPCVNINTPGHIATLRESFRVHTVHPKHVLPGEDICVFLNGGDSFPTVQNVFILIDGELNPVRFVRVSMDGFAFTGPVPHQKHPFASESVGWLDEDTDTKLDGYIRQVGTDPTNMFDVPASQNNQFRYKTKNEGYNGNGLF